MEFQKFVFTDGEIEPQIRAIVQKSKKQVILVTPYLELWGHLKNEIAKAVKRKIRVQVIVRPEEKEDKKRTDALEWLVENEVEVYELERLHAKIYLNEKNLLVSSMNLTESSTTNSLEIAMIVCDLNSSICCLLFELLNLLSSKAFLRSTNLLGSPEIVSTKTMSP